MRPRLLLLVLAAGLALPAGTGDARTPDRGSVATGKRALRTEGFRAVRISCVAGRRRALCHWTGVRRGRRCRSTLTVARTAVRGRRVRIARARCRAVPAPAAPKRTEFGFNAYANPETVALQATTGARVQRLNIAWYEVQQLPGTWNWARYDQQYKLILEAGLKPLVMVVAAPCWTHPTTGCPPMVTGPPDPAFDPDWAEFVRRVAERYPETIGIEVWNEPNLDTQFAPVADPVRFTELLKLAYAAVKSVDPELPVVSGGIFASAAPGRVPGGEGDESFLARMYAAGAGPVMDGIGFHPYPSAPAAPGAQVWDPAAMEVAVGRARRARDAAGGRQPLWLTELGESTTTQHYFPAAVSPEQQAADLRAMVRAARAAPDIPVAIIHTLVDAAANLPEDALAALVAPTTGLNISYNRVNSGFGIFTAEMRPKPAACVLSREFGGSVAC